MLPARAESGEEWGWFTEHSYRSLIKPGERFYVVAHGKLRGGRPLRACGAVQSFARAGQ